MAAQYHIKLNMNKPARHILSGTGSEFSNALIDLEFHGVSADETILPGMYSNMDNIHTVTIPSKVKLIDTKAFAGCKNLTSIKFEGSIPRIHPTAFQDCPKLSHGFTKKSGPALKPPASASMKNMIDSS